MGGQFSVTRAGGCEVRTGVVVNRGMHSMWRDFGYGLHGRRLFCANKTSIKKIPPVV